MGLGRGTTARLLVAVVLITMSLQGIGAGARTRARTYTRVPPYDFGCITNSPPCPGPVPWARARKGHLDAVTTPTPIVLYGPPFVFVSAFRQGTAAGINLRAPAARHITVTTAVHDPSAALDILTTIYVCYDLEAIDPQALASGGFLGCMKVPPGAGERYTGSVFSRDVFPGRYRLIVSMAAWDVDAVYTAVGHPVELDVDNIRYSLS